MIWSYIGVFLVILAAYKFIGALGKTIPVLELLILIAGLQWVVGAFIEYRTPFDHYKYFMYIDEKPYMSYVVPAYALFFFMTFKFKNKAIPLENINFQLSTFSSFGVLCLAVGFGSDVIQNIVPASLKFFFYLLTGFKYVGVLILFFSDKKWHRYLFYLGLVYLVIGALRSGFFHELILWSTFFYMYWAFKAKPSLKFSILIIAVGFISISLIQVVKGQYRYAIGNNKAESRTSIFANTLDDRLSSGFLENSDEQEELNVRLNQGWIISAIMSYTPQIQPYANGATIKEAIFASLLPRFLNPNKKIAGGVENFEKYTGIELQESTSMGLSLAGEGYANYGVMGGIFFMGCWGIFIGLFWAFISRRVLKNHVIFFFIPLLFLQVVKAETELVVVLNHLVKATVLIFIFLWFERSILKTKIVNK